MGARLREMIWLPATAVLLLVIYLPGLHNGLVFDDILLLANREVFRDYASLLELKVRWLSYGSFVWLEGLFGPGWWKQRLGNLVIHAGVVVALWAFYREVLRAIALPADAEPTARPYHQSPALGLAIGFFALNPVAVYGVAYLTQRSILMATLFVVAGLWCFARALRLHRWPWHVAALACYLLALLAKEHAIAAPLAALPVYILVARPSARRLALGVAAGGGLMALMGLALMLKYGEIIGQPFDELSKLYMDQLAALGPDVAGKGHLLSIVNQTYLFFGYGIRWILPYTGWMSIDLRPPFPVSALDFPHLLGPVGYLAVVGGGVFLLVRHRDWRALLGMSVLIPAALFVSEFATVWVQDPFVLYRSYLWAIGIPGLVVMAFHGVSGRLAIGVALVVGLPFVWLSLDRITSLSSPESAWSDAIAKLSDDKRSVGRWRPYLNRGNVYLGRGMADLAMKDYTASSTLGDKGMGLFNLGTAYYLEGKDQNALALFNQAERTGYDHPKLNYQWGAALQAVGQLAAAEQQLEIALGKSPDSLLKADILAIRGKIDYGLGRREKAVAMFEEALKLNPDQKEARLNLGMAFISLKDYGRAVDVLSQLMRTEPSALALYGLAVAHLELGNVQAAKSDIDRAVAMEPSNPRFRELQAVLSKKLP